MPIDPGQVVRRLREARQLSVLELARLAGVAKSTIYRLEAGDAANVRQASLDKLAAFFEVPRDDFFMDPDAVYGLVPVDGELDAKGALAGETIVRGLATRGLHYSKGPDKRRIPASGAGDGWFAARVIAKSPLLVSLNPGTPLAVNHEMRPGDVLVFRPIVVGAALVHGDLFWGTTRTEQPRSELRAFREVDGAPWAWPVSRVQHPMPMDDWEPRSVVVELRRAMRQGQG